MMLCLLLNNEQREKEMGYDSDECIACYCDNNDNNPSEYSHACCMTCLDNITTGSQHIRRVINSFHEWENNDGAADCEMCGKQNCFTYEIPLCKEHTPAPFLPKKGENLCADVDCNTKKPKGEDHDGRHDHSGRHCGECGKWYCDQYVSLDYSYCCCDQCDRWYCDACDMIILPNPGFCPPICKNCNEVAT